MTYGLSGIDGRVRLAETDLHWKKWQAGSASAVAAGFTFLVPVLIEGGIVPFCLDGLI